MLFYLRWHTGTKMLFATALLILLIRFRLFALFSAELFAVIVVAFFSTHIAFLFTSLYAFTLWIYGWYSRAQVHARFTSITVLCERNGRSQSWSTHYLFDPNEFIAGIISQTLPPINGTFKTTYTENFILPFFHL